MTNARIKLGDLSVGLTLCLSTTIRALGMDPAALFDRYGLDPERLAQPNARLSIARYMHLGHAVMQMTGNAAIGLEAARHCRLSALGLAGIATRHAPDVRQALQTLTRFEPLFMQNYRGQSSLHEDAQGAWLRFYSISPYNAYNRFAVDIQLGSWLQYLAEVTGARVPVECVQIEFDAPAYASHYEAAFGCKVEFGAAHNQLRLKRSALDMPGSDHCAGTWMHLLSLCESELTSRTRTYNIRERVVQILGPLLHGHEPQLVDVAERMGLPAWTLRRKLAEEGAGYRQLLADTRRDLAVAYIRDTDLSFGEIAYLLGFSSAEAFQRAFKRWADRTPGEYRREARG